MAIMEDQAEVALAEAEAAWVELEVLETQGDMVQDGLRIVH